MDYKLIFKPFVARNLLKMGNPIVDIKPNKDEGKEGYSIFVFEKTEKFISDLTTVLKQ